MSGKVLSILLVEDEFLPCLHIKTALAERGHVIIGPASSGRKAIALADAHRPALVLMDIRIAGDIDGIETASRILDLYQVPIVFMSGYQDQQQRERALSLKPLAYLIKPVMIRDIEAAIGKITERKEP